MIPCIGQEEKKGWKLFYTTVDLHKLMTEMLGVAHSHIDIYVQTYKTILFPLSQFLGVSTPL